MRSRKCRKSHQAKQLCLQLERMGSGREGEIDVVCMCLVWAEGGVAGDGKYELVSSSHPGKSGGRVSEGSSQNGEALHCVDLPHPPFFLGSPQLGGSPLASHRVCSGCPSPHRVWIFDTIPSRWSWSCSRLSRSQSGTVSSSPRMGSWGSLMQVAHTGMMSLSDFCHFGEDQGAGTADLQNSVFSVKPLTFVGQKSK